MATFIYLFI